MFTVVYGALDNGIGTDCSRTVRGVSGLCQQKNLLSYPARSHETVIRGPKNRQTMFVVLAATRLQ